MDTTLYRKYRPMTFDEVFGQEQIKRSLINALNENKLAHAYLFSGPRGIGKTTIARIIAKGVNCLTNGISANPCMKCENCLAISNGSSLDVVEIDAASNRGIDEIRVLKENINYQPVNCRKKVYIIDEVHMLTNEAFNALLKTLEEPPEHVIFILATTEMFKLPETIISRCVCYNFNTLTENEVLDMLRNCLTKENIKMDDDSLKLLYKKSGGSARDSFSLLEQVVSSYLNEDIDLEKTEKALGVIDSIYFKKFNEIIKKQDKKETIDFIEEIYTKGIQIEQFLKDFCDYLRVNEKDLDYAVKIIGNIYKTIYSFKNEEDNRIISYIIMYNIFDEVKTKVEVKKEVIKTVVKPSNIENFDYDAFLKFLIDGGNRFYSHILGNYRLVKVENSSIYLKPRAKQGIYTSILDNAEHLRIIEDEIFRMYDFRYKVVTVSEESKNDDELTNAIISLFEAERI